MPPVAPPAVRPALPSAAYDPAAAEQRVHDKVAEIQHEEEQDPGRGRAADRRRPSGCSARPTRRASARGRRRSPRAWAVPPPGAAGRLPAGRFGRADRAEQRLQEEREAQERSMREAAGAPAADRGAHQGRRGARRRGASGSPQLKAEEEEREQRLRELRDSVAQAEERAREAERRAAEAEQAVMRSVPRSARRRGAGADHPAADTRAAADPDHRPPSRGPSHRPPSSAPPPPAAAGSRRAPTRSHRLRRRRPRSHRSAGASRRRRAARRRGGFDDLAQLGQLRAAPRAGPLRHPGDSPARAPRAGRQLLLGRRTRRGPGLSAGPARRPEAPLEAAG